ncbi:MAG: VCBS repeat-containing protein [Thermodesulfovibrionales bacterium]
MRKIAYIGICLFFAVAAFAYAADDPVTGLANTTVSYFNPMSGSVLRIGGEDVFIAQSPGGTGQLQPGQLQPGMRLRVMRAGEPFKHPVTREVIGNVETPVGKIEVKKVSPDSVVARLVEGEAQAGDIVRLSDTKVRMLFCQDRGIDWYLADAYYRKLKSSGRIEMIDTALETGDESKILAESKRLGSEVALILTAREQDRSTFMRTRLYWVSDGTKFLDSEIKIGVEQSKDLKFGDAFFVPRLGEAVMTYDMPYRGRLLAAGDFDGDGRQEIMISNGRDIRFYIPGVDFKPLWEIKGSSADDHLWIDTVDLNGNGRDEVVVTSLRSSEVVSSIYEFTGDGFKLLWEGKYFMRRHGSGLIAQAYTNADGFSRDIFKVTWNGEYRIGDKLRMPKGVNIYDFVTLEGQGKEPLVFAYDEKGYLNLYDEKGTRVWKSGSETGGFNSTFKKTSTVTYLDAGEWSIKDRLVQTQREVMVVYRVPLTNMLKTAGYKTSSIKTYWWNGVAMEEAVTIDGIQGSVLDYAVAGDKVIILASPFMGLKFDNILKGESPLGSMLYIYSVKGR